MESGDAELKEAGDAKPQIPNTREAKLRQIQIEVEQARIKAEQAMREAWLRERKTIEADGLTFLRTYRDTLKGKRKMAIEARFP